MTYETDYQGQDSEDGYFTLTPDNFTVEQLEQVLAGMVEMKKELEA